MTIHKSKGLAFRAVFIPFCDFPKHDGWFIDKYRQADIIVCTGLGDWEQDGLDSFYNLKRAFEEKNIPAWFDTWGTDVAHDWVWWRKQMPFFLHSIGL